jgi:tetratricopeptide (TPR) repeat protein
MTRLEKLKGFVERDPNNAFALYGLAMEYKSLEEYGKAEACFSDLLRRHPEYTAAFYHYGTLLLDLGKIDQAIRVLERGIETCSRQGEIHARDELSQVLARVRAERQNP